MEYGTEISIARHRELMGLMEFVRNHSFPGFQDISIAYNSITIFYDPVIVYQNFRQSPISFVEQWLHSKATTFIFDSILPSGREHIIPVCYEPPFSPDLEAVAAFHNASPEEIVLAHQSTSYYVFMVGFSPGFPYLGLVPVFLETPRKASPALRVPAGSVGIAGRQTGIYPFTSPGGWNILGRTPLRVFNINDPDLCLLKAGDTVIFSPIDAKTFYYLNQYADS
ncbi:5-oxoprolinase subunit PxpB [Flavihumibacter fluvii]|nr:5-oxoprolinase subunit PxpB [Flavihumibacter fluvii]ULQ51651.1 5-oxoprolinase subunit PxpB [Flavihumibacter fluvii]